MQTIGNKGILSMYLGESNISSFSIGQQQIWTPDQPIPADEGFVTFSCESPFSVTIWDSPAWDGTVEYSIDKENWNIWDGTEVESNENDEIYFRGSNNTVFSGETGNGFEFDTNADIVISGNLETLLDYETVLAGNHPPMAEYCFASCFAYQLISTPGELKALELSPYCYAGMYAVSNLQVLPLLPSTNPAEGCYYGMFEGTSYICVSETQEGQYINEFRIPSVGNITTEATDWNTDMFNGTQGTFIGVPQANTTYYYYANTISPSVGINPNQVYQFNNSISEFIDVNPDTEPVSMTTTYTQGENGGVTTSLIFSVKNAIDDAQSLFFIDDVDFTVNSIRIIYTYSLFDVIQYFQENGVYANRPEDIFPSESAGWFYAKWDDETNVSLYRCSPPYLWFEYSDETTAEGWSIDGFGDWLLENCTATTEVTIPSNTIFIESPIFECCTCLESIWVTAINPPEMPFESAFADTNDCPIFVPMASLSAYTSAENWSNYADRFEPF